jgi:hypothetical protein
MDPMIFTWVPVAGAAPVAVLVLGGSPPPPR